jgi:hypothetical protein
VFRSTFPRQWAGGAVAGLAAALMVLAAILPGPAGGAETAPSDRGIGAPGGPGTAEIPLPCIALRGDDSDPDPDPAVYRTKIRYRPVLFSALLPGSGQLAQGQNRGYAYIAAEVASIAAWIVYRNQGQDTEDEYVDFAWVHARQNVSSRNVRGTDEYYEHLAKWVKSGEFDTDRNYDLDDPFTIDPWTDPETFNGDAWRIATITFFEPDTLGALVGERADSLAALQFYAGRAFQSEFYWDWTMNNTVEDYKAQQNRYKDLRDESNAAFRRATVSLVVLMANHVISVVDAFATSRVEIAGDPGDRRTRLDMRLKGGRGPVPGAVVRLTREF